MLPYPRSPKYVGDARHFENVAEAGNDSPIIWLGKFMISSILFPTNFLQHVIAVPIAEEFTTLRNGDRTMTRKDRRLWLLRSTNYYSHHQWLSRILCAQEG